MTVNPVTVEAPKIVVLFPVKVIFPDPNASVLVLLLLELNTPQLRVLLLISSVPAVTVNVRNVAIVNVPTIFTVAPGALTVRGLFIVRPLLVIVCVPDVAANVNALGLDVNVIPVDAVKSPKMLIGVFAVREPLNPLVAVITPETITGFCMTRLLSAMRQYLYLP